MDEVSRLFDRRCRTPTALVHLARLRRRLKWFTKLGKALDNLHGPTLEKALTYLDDRLLQERKRCQGPFHGFFPTKILS
jgi:hypothetical protein